MQLPIFRGFILPLTLLIMAILLGVTLSVASYVYTQLVLAQDAAASLGAIVVAENAVEYALWHQRQGPNPDAWSEGDNIDSTDFNLSYSPGCAQITIEEKKPDGLRVKAIGFSSCPVTTRTAQRALCFKYGPVADCPE